MAGPPPAVQAPEPAWSETPRRRASFHPGHSSCVVAATVFAVREAAGWHERRVHLADLRSECQPAAERLSEDRRGATRARAAGGRARGVTRRLLMGVKIKPEKTA